MNVAALASLYKMAKGARGTYFRIVDSRFAAQVDEIAHTVLFSWRYNPKGEFGVLYLSSSPECCWREKLKQVHGRSVDLPPQVIGGFKVRLSRCLDLTDASCLAALGVAPEELIQPAEFSRTQDLARQARVIGFQAIIAPSAIGADCHSLVVFKDRLAPPHYCTLTPNSVRPCP